MERHPITLAWLLLTAWLPAQDAVALQPADLQPVPASHGILPNAFGSLALEVRNSPLRERWVRAFRPAEHHDLLALIGSVRSSAGTERLRRVNAIVNRAIRYRPDDRGSVGDSWAPAQETLQRRAGDCEDIAIVKFQALRALGVPERDLFLTIGNKGHSGLAHAVLLARTGGQIWVLDNLEDRLLSEEEYRDFKPIVSFNGGGTWVHGFRLPRIAQRK